MQLPLYCLQACYQLGPLGVLTEDFCSIGPLDISKAYLQWFCIDLSCNMSLVPMSIGIVLATFKDSLIPLRQVEQISISNDCMSCHMSTDCTVQYTLFYKEPS